MAKSKKERLEEIEKEMMAILRGCRTYETTKDGSHGACLHANGYHELVKEKAELEGHVTRSNSSQDK